MEMFYEGKSGQQNPELQPGFEPGNRWTSHDASQYAGEAHIRVTIIGSIFPQTFSGFI